MRPSPREVDTGLRGFCLCLFGDDVADRGVPLLPIVVGFDIGEQVARGGIVIGVLAVVNKLGFQSTEEALHRCECVTAMRGPDPFRELALFPCGLFVQLNDALTKRRDQPSAPFRRSPLLNSQPSTAAAAPAVLPPIASLRTASLLVAPLSAVVPWEGVSAR